MGGIACFTRNVLLPPHKEAFDGRLEFDIKLLPYKGDDSWVEGVIFDAIECLKSNKLPKFGADCDFCKYREAVNEVIK